MNPEFLKNLCDSYKNSGKAFFETKVNTPKIMKYLSERAEQGFKDSFICFVESGQVDKIKEYIATLDTTYGSFTIDSCDRLHFTINETALSDQNSLLAALKDELKGWPGDNKNFNEVKEKKLLSALQNELKECSEDNKNTNETNAKTILIAIEDELKEWYNDDLNNKNVLENRLRALVAIIENELEKLSNE